MSAAGDTDARLGEILEVLLAIARQDFTARAAVSGRHDTLDGIAVGLNMLAEELSGEVASRRELERAHAELKQAQARMIHAGKLVAVGQLASGVAHEINNPAMSLEAALAIVKRACDLAHGKPPTEDELRTARAAVDDAQEAVARIRRLTGDLRTFARADEETHQLLRLDEIATVSCRLAAPTVRARAQLVMDLPEVPPVMGSRGRLGQVVTNLLVNAAQAVPEGGPARHFVSVSTHVTGERVALVVEDSGPGVPSHLRERIFEPFFTTKPEGVGTGLGLTLVAEIVAAHGGRISVGEGARGGARFELSFPAAAAAVPAPVAGVEEDEEEAAARKQGLPGAPVAGTGEALRVLLIDDEPLIIRLFTTLLQANCKLVTAGSGAEAVGLLEKDRAFDVVLCDLHMPAVDGIHVYETVQRLQPELLRRFVFTTGGAITSRSREFLDRVQPRVLAKPFPVEELFALIRDLTRASA